MRLIRKNQSTPYWERGRPARSERGARKDLLVCNCAPAARCGRDARAPRTRRLPVSLQVQRAQSTYDRYTAGPRSAANLFHKSAGISIAPGCCIRPFKGGICEHKVLLDPMFFTSLNGGHAWLRLARSSHSRDQPTRAKNALYLLLNPLAA
jgi:hypothetical protein